jgi:hypothetical protein
VLRHSVASLVTAQLYPSYRKLTVARTPSNILITPPALLWHLSEFFHELNVMPLDLHGEICAYDRLCGLVVTVPRSWVRFPALPDFLSTSGSGTGSTQPLWG